MCTDHGFTEKICLAVKGDRLGACHLEIEFEMILQICANTGPVCAHCYAVALQLVCRADAGKLQQLDRIDRPARKDDLACGAQLMHLARLFIFHADSARAFEQDACRQRMFDNVKIGPLAGFIQIGFGRRTARAVSHGHVHPAKAFLGIAVIVFGQAIARLLRRIEPCLMQWIVERAIAGRQRAISAAICVAAFVAPFGAFKIRQHIGIAPAGGAFIFFPTFKIERIATNVNKPVDRR